MPEKLMPRASNDSVIYGIHAAKEVLHQRKNDIERIYFAEAKKNEALFELLKYCRKHRLSYQHVPEHKITALAGSDKHQGIVITRCANAFAGIDEINQILKASRLPLVMIPASIEDPHNLGAVIRSAVACGVDAMLLERKSTVSITGSVAKASAGMIEHLALAKPRNLEGIIAEYKAGGMQVVGADMAGDQLPWELNFATPTVIISGGEHRGIPPYLRKQCTALVKIPMRPVVPSLNVSVSVGMLLYEIVRQRVGAGSDAI
ncbi:MAG: 23S rRNA (guanosine(2251)-2'-O)-methyltransferase RlmB [Chitinivibrionales bacterium]|nr:23S rRNA (guanosine(2251)-2'-O)-methyltransferase RlmB [Chitinivibrionales bacterium]